MRSHLLSLSALHAAAPGVLDVIFGPDGDFEGAPPFVGPVLTPAGGPCWFWTEHNGMVRCFAECGQYTYPLDRVALDLRVPSVAARLAGLCARALSLPGISYSLSWSTHERGGYVLSRPMEQRPGRPYMAAWGLDGLPIRCYSDADAPLPPPVPVHTDRRSLESFLAALTLALAPQIARLTQPRMP